MAAIKITSKVNKVIIFAIMDTVIVIIVLFIFFLGFRYLYIIDKSTKFDFTSDLDKENEDPTKQFLSSINEMINQIKSVFKK